MGGDLHIVSPSLPSTPRKVLSGHRMKSSILYLHSPGVRPKFIVRPSGHPLIQDSLTHRTLISRYKTTEVLLSSSSHLASLLLLLPFPPSLFAGARDEALIAEVMPDWYVILVCGGLAALLGFSVLLCVMIFDDHSDAAARVLALRGGSDHED